MKDNNLLFPYFSMGE